MLALKVGNWSLKGNTADSLQHGISYLGIGDCYCSEQTFTGPKGKDMERMIPESVVRFERQVHKEEVEALSSLRSYCSQRSAENGQVAYERGSHLLISL